jgi:hypothetical protein
MSAMRRGDRRMRRITGLPGAPRVAGRPTAGGRASDDAPVAAVPRLALTPTEAAAALGIGLTSFKKYVQPQLRIVRRGKLRVIPVSEVERWAEENAERVLDGTSEALWSDSERV